MEGAGGGLFGRQRGAGSHAVHQLTTGQVLAAHQQPGLHGGAEQGVDIGADAIALGRDQIGVELLVAVGLQELDHLPGDGTLAGCVVGRAHAAPPFCKG
jgi:hypothetical protein